MMYLFHIPIPILFCDLEDFFHSMGTAWEDCVDQVGLIGAEACVTDPVGTFKTEWSECIDGRLTQEEQVLSEQICSAFTNFTVFG